MNFPKKLIKSLALTVLLTQCTAQASWKDTWHSITSFFRSETGKMCLIVVAGVITGGCLGLWLSARHKRKSPVLLLVGSSSHRVSSISVADVPYPKINYPYDARLKPAPGEDQITFDREKIIDVEGFWADSEDKDKDSYKGQYPFPKGNVQPLPALKPFIAKLKRIQAVQEYQFTQVFDEQEQLTSFVDEWNRNEHFWQSNFHLHGDDAERVRFAYRARRDELATIVRSISKEYNRKDSDARIIRQGCDVLGYKGPGCRFRNQNNCELGFDKRYTEFEGNDFEDRVSKVKWQTGCLHYYEVHNVIPSREFYRYVMNFSEDELRKMEKVAPERQKQELKRDQLYSKIRTICESVDIPFR